MFDGITTIDPNGMHLSEDHHNSIVSLINKIVAKSPHLSQLRNDSVVYSRLVSVISLIETTLCSQYQLILKRNVTRSQSIAAIKSWLNQYYRPEFVEPLCRPIDHQISHCIDINDTINDEIDVATDGHTNGDNNIVDITDEYNAEDVDRDIGLVSLLILFIAHKLRQSLPRINAYFSPEWQTLSQFAVTLNGVLNFDKLLDLIQNELCIKRQQLEVTKSKVLSLKSIINSRDLDQNRLKKSRLDYRSNLFSEYEDNDCEQRLDGNNNDDEVSGNSDGSAVFVDHSSDDDYEPKNKAQKSSMKRPIKRTLIGRKSGRGRGRPSKQLQNAIQITGHQPTAKHRGRPPKLPKAKQLSTEYEVKSVETIDEPFVCETCGKSFEKEYRLVRHNYTHLGHKQYQCNYPDCGQSFNLKYKLVDHKAEHRADGAMPFDDDDDDQLAGSGHYLECEWADCGMGFGSKRELTQHEHTMHANRSQSKYSCDWPQCRDVFANKIDWRKHVRTHGKITPTECGYPGCQLSFYKLDALENHRKIHETFTLDDLT